MGATAKADVEIDIDLELADRVSERALERGLRGVVLEGVRIVKEELSQPGSGKLYKRGSVTHQASAPGEPPAPDTGTLRESTNGEVIIRAGKAKAVISVDGEQAEALELGTEHIQPRPFISPLLGKYAGRLLSAFQITGRVR